MSIEQTQLIWPVLLAGGLLWLVFIWKEWNARSKPRFYSNVLISFLGIAALAMIVLQPTILKKDTITYTAILSPGYQSSQLDSLRAEYKDLKEIDYSSGKDLSNDIQKGQEVFLLGQGLQSYDLWQLDNIKVALLSGIDPKGLSRLTYTVENVTGSDFEVKGEYLQAPKGQQLVLTGPGDISLDSISLKAIDRQNFELHTPLSVTGKYVYNLIEKDSLGNVVSKDPIPVNIMAQNKLNILIINQFPSFETKYLKNFLAESGHQLQVRSQVSQGRYKYEFFNSQQRGNIQLNRKTLEEMDLLIIDLSSLMQSSKSTLRMIQRVISEQGLGLFVQADEGLYRSRVPLLDFSFLQQDDNEVTLKRDPKNSISKYPFIFKSDLFLEPVQQSVEGVITAYKRSGEGRIGTTVVQNSYGLLLEGKTSAYQRFWSNALSMISKRSLAETVWKSDEIFAYQDIPFDFEITTSQESPMVKSAEDFSISLAQDIDLKEKWSGTTYPRRLGWNKLLMSHDSTAVFDFYVLDTSDWTSLITAKTIAENKRYFKEKTGAVRTSSSRQPIQPWWFFLIFLAAMSYLWLEPKL